MNSPGARVAAPDITWLAGLPVTAPAAPAAPAVSFCLEPDPAQVARGRALTRAALAGWGLARHGWLAELIVSELVSNAIVHGVGLVSVRLCSGSGCLRVAVHDGHPGRPVRRSPSAADEAGRGLELIDGLIGLYGGERGTSGDNDGPGKTVHATVRLPDDAADGR
jgi:Histidine kinase-like ATPase domain